MTTNLEDKTIELIEILLNMQKDGELTPKETIDGIKRLLIGRG